MSESTTASDIEKLKNPISEVTKEDTVDAREVVGLRAGEESGDPAGSQASDPQETPAVQPDPPQSTAPQPPDWVDVGPRDHLPTIEGVPYDNQGKRPSEVIKNTIDFDKLRAALADDPTLYEQIEGRFRGMYRENKALDRYLNQLQKDNLIFQEAQAQQEAVQQREEKKSELERFQC